VAGPQVEQRQAVPRLALGPARRRPVPAQLQAKRLGISQRRAAIQIEAHPGTLPAKSLRAQVTLRLGTLVSKSSRAGG
jgi:hypothetical protein